jgi:TatD DNase family protein
MAKKFKIVKACLGIHPWYADEWNNGVAQSFKDHSREAEVVAVSEIGLDYMGRMTKEWVREDRYIDKDTQIRGFRDQIILAEEMELPVLVHDRTPAHEVIDILEDTGAIESGAAIHGFSKDHEYAARCIDLGIYLSIGLRDIQSASPEFLETVRDIPLKWILTETDSSDPYGIFTVCEIIGKIKDKTKEEVGATATRNLKKLIGL